MKEVDIYYNQCISELPSWIGYRYKKLISMRVLGCAKLKIIPESIMYRMNDCDECKELYTVYTDIAPLIDAFSTDREDPTVQGVKKSHTKHWRFVDYFKYFMKHRGLGSLQDRVECVLCVLDDSHLALWLTEPLPRWDEELNCIVSYPTLIDEDDDERFL